MSRIANLMSAGPNATDPETAAAYRIGWFNLMKTLVRFERWDDILDGKTLPFLNQPFETVWYHWAQGLSHASREDFPAARQSLMSMEEMIQLVGQMVNPVPRQFQVGRSELAAYIETKAGNMNAGMAGLNQAARLESELPYTDPTVYPRPVLELLGRTALEARDFQTAESAYRKALENEPGGARALWGLATALAGRGNNQEAESTMAEFRRVWRGDDGAHP
jgi:hypothetical protein